MRGFYDEALAVGMNDQDGPYWQGRGDSTQDRLFAVIEAMAADRSRLDAMRAQLSAAQDDARIWFDAADVAGKLAVTARAEGWKAGMEAAAAIVAEKCDGDLDFALFKLRALAQTGEPDA